MTRRNAKRALVCWLLVAGETLCVNGYAKPQRQDASTPLEPVSAEAGDKNSEIDLPTKQTDDAYESVNENTNALGVSFLKNLLSDQKAIWTSPTPPSVGRRDLVVSACRGDGGFFCHRPSRSPGPLHGSE